MAANTLLCEFFTDDLDDATPPAHGLQLKTSILNAAY
jgi:hypothetical protein